MSVKQKERNEFSSPMIANQLSAKQVRAPRILMLLENEGYPADSRVMLEAESLRDAGYEVTVICRKDDCRRAAEEVRGVQVYRYPAPLQLNGFVGYLLE
ncbi:MAG: glycosyltransferase, partial [Planctomycetota bacterium]